MPIKSVWLGLNFEEAALDQPQLKDASNIKELHSLTLPKAPIVFKGASDAVPNPASDSEQLDRELPPLREANARVYAKPSPWKRK